jgi:hypothetical protein
MQNPACGITESLIAVIFEEASRLRLFVASHAE